MPLPPPPIPTIMKFYFRNRINESLQAGNGTTSGDDVYYCPSVPHGGFKHVDNTKLNTTGIVHIGKATSVNKIDAATKRYELIVLIDSNYVTQQGGTMATNITNGYNKTTDFIMFSKNTHANRSSLAGYYAEVSLANDSPGPAELFGVSTEASESSK